MNAKLAVVLGSLLFAGCGLKPELVKHYDSHSTRAELDTLRVYSQATGPSKASEMLAGSYTISAFIMPVPPKQPGPLVGGLSDRGQSTLVTELGEREKTTDDLVAAVARANVKAPPACDPAGPIRFERRLVLSLSGRHLLPSMRLDAMAYRLELTKAQAKSRFVSWNRFESQHDTVSLGTTRLKQSQGGSITDVSSDTITKAATATVPGSTLVDSLTAVANTSRELEETVASARRFTPLTGTLSNRQAAIVQQGAVGLDLFGNIAADFTIEIPDVTTEVVLSTKGLIDKGIAQTDDKEISLNWCDRVHAANPEAIEASLDAASVLRSVADGASTAIEGDDAATFATLTSKTPALLTLVSADELGWDAHYIARLSAAGKIEFLQSGDAYGGVISFASLDQAKIVVTWLRLTKKSSLKGVPLGWPGANPAVSVLDPYSPSDAASLMVVRERVSGGIAQRGPVWK